MLINILFVKVPNKTHYKPPWTKIGPKAETAENRQEQKLDQIWTKRDHETLKTGTKKADSKEPAFM